MIDGSVAGTDLATDINRPPLPAPTESTISLNNGSHSVSNADSGIDAYSVPDDGTPITIRTSRIARPLLKREESVERERRHVTLRRLTEEDARIHDEILRRRRREYSQSNSSVMSVFKAVAA